MLTTAVFLAAAGLATATTIPVSVGKNGLTFEPNMIHAQEGDVIEFRFWPRNHSVVAGDFAHACRPAANNGFFSGFFPTQPNTVNNQVFQVTVNHTNPMPIYCSQNTGQHCKNGMVAVINPAGSGELTFDAYAALARGAGNATSPQGGVFGGRVAPNPAASGSSGGAGGGGASSTATTTAAESTETQTQTQTQTQKTQTETGTATTGGGAGGGTSTTTNAPTGTGNAAAGVAVPVAGLVAVAMGAFFV